MSEDTTPAVLSEAPMTADPVVALLPCPFCGCEPWVEPENPSIEGDAWTRISCTDCEVAPSIKVCTDGTHFAQAAAAWNTRTPAPAGDVRVVPVEPTDEMLAAAARGLSAQSTCLGWDPSSVWSAMLAASPTPDTSAVSGSAEGEPVAWCSPGQLANLMDVDADGGVYLPIRKTERGNFTMPLFASPKASALACSLTQNQRTIVLGNDTDITSRRGRTRARNDLRALRIMWSEGHGLTPLGDEVRAVLTEGQQS